MEIPSPPDTKSTYKAFPYPDLASLWDIKIPIFDMDEVISADDGMFLSS